MVNKSTNTIGYDAEAYAHREKGYSPDPIRNATWDLVKADLGGYVLDAGSGEGGWIKRLKQSPKIQKIISTDIFDYGASNISEVEFHLADLSFAKLPCPDDYLDWVFALEVLEHLANPRNFVKQAARSLKKNGKFVITTPCNDSIRAKANFCVRGYFSHFSESEYRGVGHITPITEVDLRRMSSEAGFEDVTFYYPISGRIPKTTSTWSSVSPFLHGKLYADTLFAILTK